MIPIPTSIQHLISQLDSLQTKSPASIANILSHANIAIEDLLPWSDYDHPACDGYGRKMVYDGDSVEIMVMSWSPGDFSAIHDHGHTTWGAVKILGPAEHAIFKIEEGKLRTLARWIVKNGDVVPVNHDLIHQMGNPYTDQIFLSLHVYGTDKKVDHVTEEARLFDPGNAQILRVSGGVFYGLAEKDINSLENGPEGDFVTILGDEVQYLKYLIRNDAGEALINQSYERTFWGQKQVALLNYLQEIVDTNTGKYTSERQWNILTQALTLAAEVQSSLRGVGQSMDNFETYAFLYDEVIGRPCLKEFMGNYLQFFSQSFDIEVSQIEVLSIGCGTGLVEKWMIEEMGIPWENLLGFDFSKSMVGEASKRIKAEYGDILDPNTEWNNKDLVYSGLNVFQYLSAEHFESAIGNTASLLKPGGYFIGDFITQDHMRWYPNAIYAEDQHTISLRTPDLVERESKMYQESNIVNVLFRDGEMNIFHAGKHKRYLPTIEEVKGCFAKYFGEIYIFDAISLKPTKIKSNTTPSTRYLVVARKQF